MQTTRLAAARALPMAGRMSETRMEMMATTTKSSMSVKAFAGCCFGRRLNDMV